MSDTRNNEISCDTEPTENRNCTQTGTINDPLLNVMPQPLIEPEVIKGSENLKSSDLKTEVECGHMDDERYGEIVFNGIVYKLVPTDQGRGPRSRKNSECSHVLASKQPKLFETGEFMIDIMVANCWCPKCGEKL